MGLVNDLRMAMDEMKVDIPTLEGQQTLYLNVIATGIATIADIMAEEHETKNAQCIGIMQFRALKEEVINEIPITAVGDVKVIFDKYEEAAFSWEEDDD